MSTQVSHTIDLQAWVQWLRTHAAITRQLNADLIAGHGLTINDYEVLLHLAKAPEGRSKPVDLARRVVLTPSGITRLLTGLERAGYVERVTCASDGGVSYAQLTPAGARKLREAADTHVAGIEAQFQGRFSEGELRTLSALLARLPGGEPDGGTCEP